MSQYRIQHRTAYRYTEKVSLSHNQLFMVPIHQDGQECIACEYRITPNPTTLHTKVDFYGNKRVYFSVERAHTFLEITVDSRVRTVEDTPTETVDYGASDLPTLLVQEPMTEDAFRTTDFTLPSPMIRVLPRGSYGILEDLQMHDCSALEFLDRVTGCVFNDFKFDASATTILTPLEQVIKKRHGVCQDFTHLCISFLRSHGIPAGYVSGYVETLPPPGRARLRGVDASHAWFRAFLPRVGWVDFDPTNGKRRDARYIEVAGSRDYSDTPPLKGIVYGGGQPSMEVAVDVIPEDAPPADEPSKPA